MNRVASTQSCRSAALNGHAFAHTHTHTLARAKGVISPAIRYTEYIAAASLAAGGSKLIWNCHTQISALMVVRTISLDKAEKPVQKRSFK